MQTVTERRTLPKLSKIESMRKTTAHAKKLSIKCANTILLQRRQEE